MEAYANLALLALSVLLFSLGYVAVASARRHDQMLSFVKTCTMVAGLGVAVGLAMDTVEGHDRRVRNDLEEHARRARQDQEQRARQPAFAGAN